MEPKLIQQRSTRARQNAWSRLLRTACAALVVVAPVLAGDAPGSGRPAPPPPGPNDNLASGDETIGTLPIQGPAAPFDLIRFLIDHEASISLEGVRFDVLSSIVELRGRIAVTIEVLDAATDTVRYTFHGAPVLRLDRSAVESGAVHVGLKVPVAFGDGTLSLSTAGRQVDSVALTPGPTSLPIGPLLASGRIDGRPAVIRALGHDAERTRIVAFATRQFLILGRTH